MTVTGDEEESDCTASEDGAEDTSRVETVRRFFGGEAPPTRCSEPVRSNTSDVERLEARFTERGESGRRTAASGTANRLAAGRAATEGAPAPGPV